jgi:biopolymer transport protein ExbB/TolQ
MPLFIGLIFSVLVAALWLVWSVIMLAAAAVFFAWPIVFLIVAALLWRGPLRLWQRTMSATSGASSAVPRSSSEPEAAEAGGRNSAFEEYREATLRRLDEEASRFSEFLDRMRGSRDKQEFDAYMAERRARTVRDTFGDAVRQPVREPRTISSVPAIR